MTLGQTAAMMLFAVILGALPVVVPAGAEPTVQRAEWNCR